MGPQGRGRVCPGVLGAQSTHIWEAPGADTSQAGPQVTPNTSTGTGPLAASLPSPFIEAPPGGPPAPPAASSATPPGLPLPGYFRAWPLVRLSYSGGHGLIYLSSGPSVSTVTVFWESGRQPSASGGGGRGNDSSGHLAGRSHTNPRARPPHPQQSLLVLTSAWDPAAFVPGAGWASVSQQRGETEAGAEGCGGSAWRGQGQNVGEVPTLGSDCQPAESAPASFPSGQEKQQQHQPRKQRRQTGTRPVAQLGIILTRTLAPAPPQGRRGLGSRPLHLALSALPAPRLCPSCTCFLLTGSPSARCAGRRFRMQISPQGLTLCSLLCSEEPPWPRQSPARATR